MKLANPNEKPLVEKKESRSGFYKAPKDFVTSTVIDKKYEQLDGQKIREVDVTETLGFLLAAVDDKRTQAKTGIVEEKDLTYKYKHPTSATGAIISDSNTHFQPALFVYSSTLCTTWANMDKYIDTKFQYLKETIGTELHLPQIYEAWGLNGMQFGNCKVVMMEDSKVARRLGEEYIISVKANHHLIIKLKALNYFNEDIEASSDADTSCEWIFSSGEDNYTVNVLEKVQNLGSVLDIPNIQRENIGRYTCRVVGKLGTVMSKTIYVHVDRPGTLQEETRTIQDIEFPTGTMIFVEDLTELHDEKYKWSDDKVVWSDEEDGWIDTYWDFDKEDWFESKMVQKPDQSDMIGFTGVRNRQGSSNISDDGEHRDD